jgi:hypothetical protein
MIMLPTGMSAIEISAGDCRREHHACDDDAGAGGDRPETQDKRTVHSLRRRAAVR